MKVPKNEKIVTVFYDNMEDKTVRYLITKNLAGVYTKYNYNGTDYDKGKTARNPILLEEK